MYERNIIRRQGIIQLKNDILYTTPLLVWSNKVFCRSTEIPVSTGQLDQSMDMLIRYTRLFDKIQADRMTSFLQLITFHSIILKVKHLYKKIRK
jgi:hypothetical protein